MQELLLLNTVAFPQKDNDLATQEERIKGLETTTGNIRESLGEIKGQIKSLQQPTKSSTHLLIPVVGSALCLAVLWYWGWIGLQVVDHGKKLTEIYALLAPQRLGQISSNAANSENAKIAEQILANSRKSGISIPPTVVENVGEKFIEAAIHVPQSWDAALAFFDCRTFLNTDLTPQLSNLKKVEPNTKGPYMFSLNLKPKSGTEHEKDVLAVTIATSDETTEPEESARLEQLSAPQSHGSRHSKIVVTGGADELLLDGQYLKNVTIINADVDYEGGPVRLENVLFINCRFHFVNQQPSRNLGQSILRAAIVNFSQNVG